jgi:hypothetical protein
MASSVGLGTPLFVDDAPNTAATPFRSYEIGTRVNNVGTASANQVAGGVFPGVGAMAVTPGSGLAVQVAAGYCCVPAASALQGGYVFGAMTSQSLTLAAADPTNPRIDLVTAQVTDTGTSASSCSLSIVTGTAAFSPSPPSLSSLTAIVLAAVQVGAGVASLTSANITDERAYVTAPGGILPISSAAAAPAAPAWQLFYNVSAGALVTGSGTAGVVSPLPVLPWAPVISQVATTMSDSSSPGTLTTITTCSITTGGEDIEVFYKWPGWKVSSAPLLVTVQVSLDGTVMDQTVLFPASSSLASCGGSARWYSSAAESTTPSAGSHTVAFAFQSASGSATTTLAASGTALAVLRAAPASA